MTQFLVLHAAASQFTSAHHERPHALHCCHGCARLLCHCSVSELAVSHPPQAQRALAAAAQGDVAVGGYTSDAGCGRREKNKGEAAARRVISGVWREQGTAASNAAAKGVSLTEVLQSNACKQASRTN